MVLGDRHCELRNGLPSVLDQCRCFLREEHQSSWRHHASSELCGRCASDDSHFGVCLRSQGFNKNDQDLGGGALATNAASDCLFQCMESCRALRGRHGEGHARRVRQRGSRMAENGGAASFEPLRDRGPAPHAGGTSRHTALCWRWSASGLQGRPRSRSRRR